MFQCSFKWVSRVFEKKFKREFQGSCKGVSSVLKVSRVCLGFLFNED